MRKTAGFLFILLIVSGFPFSAGAGDWPDNPEYVIGPFGTPENGYFSRGLSFLSEGQRLNAWSGGEVIWTSDNQCPVSLPGDGLLVLEHSDGFRTSYSGIEVRPDLGDSVSGGEWLGYAADDSWLFEITDNKQSRIVDPVTLLPSRNNPPKLSFGAVELVRGSKVLQLGKDTVLTPGTWAVVIHDLFSPEYRAIPAEISLFWVGQSIGNIRFDALEECGNNVVLKTPEPSSYNHIYNYNGQLWFPNVLLIAGKGTLELRIRDELGRVVSRSWKLTVR